MLAKVDDAAAGPDTRRLIHLPLQATGLGIPLFERHLDVLHSTMVGAAKWPPPRHCRHTQNEIAKANRTALKAFWESDLEGFKKAVWRKAHHDESRDWLEIRAIKSEMRIRDHAWINAFRDRLYFDDPKLHHQRCSALHTPDRAHYFGCKYCQAGWWTLRHNLVGEAFRCAARANSLLASKGFKALYDVDRSCDEAPDMILFTHEDVPVVIDFSVAHQSDDTPKDCGAARHATKHLHYAHWRPDTCRIVPVVVSTRYTVHTLTLKEVKQITKATGRREFTEDACSFMKVALINAEGYRAKQLATSAIPHPTAAPIVDTPTPLAASSLAAPPHPIASQQPAPSAFTVSQ